MIDAPADLARQGFTNNQRIRVRITEEYLGWWLIRVPCTLPLGEQNPQFLALEVDRHDLTIVVIPRDEEATCDH